jgi:tRNA threonylcarbamoyladenosine biosynthesis protein TsaB
MATAARRPDRGAVGPERPWDVDGGVLAADAVVLAIDTSSRIGGVALCRGATIVGEETWQAGGSQTAQVLPAAARLWERAGLTVRDVAAVVVALGPGSFTGLRVGASLGKGLALALNVPLAGVATLDVVAYQHCHAAAQLCAVVQAGRGQLYVGMYRRWQGRPRRAGNFMVRDVSELAEDLAAVGQAPFVCGELDPAAVAVLEGRVGGRLRLASPAAALRRTAFLAELGRWQIAAHGRADAAALQPIYLRRGVEA